MRTVLVTSVLVVLVAGVSATTIRSTQWWDQEIRIIRNSIEEVVNMAKMISAKVDEMMQKVALEQEHVRQPVIPPKRKRYPTSCMGYYQMGDTRNGFKTIDPYLNSRPFTVKCEFNDQQVVTEFGLSGASIFRFKGPMRCQNSLEFWVPGNADVCTESKTPVNYNLSKDELRAALAVSGRCSQRIYWDCMSNRYLYLKDNSRNTTVYGYPIQRESLWLKQGYCECKTARACSTCNCARDGRRDWLRDTIVLDEKFRLPLKEVAVGDMKYESKHAQVSVNPVRCHAPLPFSA